LSFFNQDEQGQFVMNTALFLSRLLFSSTALMLCATLSVVHAQESDKERKEDIQRHRAMAAAHDAAAKCLESGKKEDVCGKELQAACKGLAVGKYCGLKHVH
jgi:hypothetical protein